MKAVSNLYNQTSLDDIDPLICVNTSVNLDMAFDFTDALVITLYSVAFVVSLTGNLTMLIILLRNLWNQKHQRRVVTLLLHMNVADLMTTCVSLPKEIIHTATVAWHGPDWLCRLMRLFDVFGVYLSANVLICISLDRFMSIVSPLYTLREHRTIKVMLVVAWTLAIISSLPQLLLFRAATHPCFRWYTQCISRSILGEVNPYIELTNTLLNALEAYFVPLCIVCFCYYSILRKLRHEEANSGAAFRTPNSYIRRKAQQTGRQTTAVETKAETPETTRTIVDEGSTTSEQPSPRYHRRRLMTSSSRDYQSMQSIEKVSSPKKTILTAAPPSHPRPASFCLRRSSACHVQRAKSRTLRMTIVMVLAFLICWTPYYLMATLHFADVDYATGRLRGRLVIPQLLVEILNVSACLNSVVNPYLYGHFSFDLRRELQQLLASLRRHKPALGQRQRRACSPKLTRCDLTESMMPMAAMTSAPASVNGGQIAVTVHRSVADQLSHMTPAADKPIAAAL